MNGFEPTPTIVVGSGKGGVGKSVVSVLLATALAGRAAECCCSTASRTWPTCTCCWGPAGRSSRCPAAGRDRRAGAGAAVAPNLWLLPGESGAEGLYALDALDRARLQHRLSEVYGQFDVVIVDAGAGIESVVRAATMRATRLLVVTAPEPTALTDAYALMKIVSLQLPELPIDVLVNRCLDARRAATPTSAWPPRASGFCVAACASWAPSPKSSRFASPSELPAACWRRSRRHRRPTP